MSGADLGLALGVFLACAVEMVEALTIVLAVGSERGYRSTLFGAGTALAALGIVVAVLGPAIALVPLGPMRVITGLVMLYVGAGWMRKAVLRQAGLKAKHDEKAIWREERARAAGAGRAKGFDAYAFVAAFKGVGLEGFEVVVICLTLGAANIGVAAGAAAIALAVVATAGLVLRAPLSRVPENAMKLIVATMLVSFGVFWTAEGLGYAWPAGDAALLVLIPAVGALALVAAVFLEGRALSKGLREMKQLRESV